MTERGFEPRTVWFDILDLTTEALESSISTQGLLDILLINNCLVQASSQKSYKLKVAVASSCIQQTDLSKNWGLCSLKVLYPNWS